MSPGNPQVFNYSIWGLGTCLAVSVIIVSFQVNPPYYIPLVEIIPAPWTDQSIIDRTTEIMKGLGQAPVKAKKEINGFIVNRLQYALIMEAWRLVEVSVVTSL